MSVTTTNYAQVSEVKQRLNIPDVNKDSDEKIGTQCRDADSFVNVQIGVHAVVHLTNPDPQLISLASGLAAALYNYWQTPAKDRTLEAVDKWEKRISDHLKAVYGQRDVSGTSGRTFTSSNGVTGAE